jgi:WD40 repeat protein
LDGCDPVAFTPDGTTLISGGDGASIKLWHQVP